MLSRFYIIFSWLQPIKQLIIKILHYLYHSIIMVIFRDSLFCFEPNSFRYELEYHESMISGEILIGFLGSAPLLNLKRSQENRVTNIYYLLYSLYINAKYYSLIHYGFSFSKTNDHITMKLGTKLTLKSLTLTKKTILENSVKFVILT